MKKIVFITLLSLFICLTGSKAEPIFDGGLGMLGMDDDVAGLTDPMTTRGDMIIRDATNTTERLGVGANGEVVGSDGTDISWVTATTGDVTKVGTPINDQIGVWTGDGTLEGDTNFTWDGTTHTITGALTVNDSVGIGTVTPNEKLEIDYGHIRMNQEVAPTAPTVAVNVAAGNLNGTYFYRVTFITSLGESDAGATSASVAPASEQVDLSSIPTGSVNVTSRKIYRTTAGGSSNTTQLVTTIADNVTTIYTDNIVDGSLGVFAPFSNTTGANFYTNTVKTFEAGPGVTLLGYNAGSVNTGFSNTFFGRDAGSSNTTGDSNTFGGSNAGSSNTTGFSNNFFGSSAGSSNTTGNRNNFFGKNAGINNTTGIQNTFCGSSAGSGNTTGSFSAFFGRNAGFSNTTGDSNNFFGKDAGRFIADGSSPNQTTGTSVYLGNATKASADGVANETVIGNNAIGKGSNTVILGAEGANTAVYATGGLIVNEEGLDVDSRIEGLLTVNLFYANAGEDRIGINTASPNSLLDVQGAAGADGRLTLSTAELTIVDGDKLGQIDFQAPLESSGTDAILPAASIWAEADATFDVATNTASLVFATANSETATEKFRIDGNGNVGIGVTDPDTQLEILNAGDQLKLSFDGTDNTVFAVDTQGDMTVTPSGTQTIMAGNFSMANDKLILRDTNSGLTASTTQTQGQGALTAAINEVSIVANDDDTVTLFAATTGAIITIINNGANTLQIFPASGDDLGSGVNVAQSLEANEDVVYVAYDSTNWSTAASTEIKHAEMHDEDNTDAFVINDAGADFHSYHTNGLASGDLAGWTFDIGGGGTSFPIASIADAGGGDITVTTTGTHGLAIGDIISQTNLADVAYVGVFDVLTVPTTTTYTVTAAFTATGTGTMDQASVLIVNPGSAGTYFLSYWISSTSATNNETFDFQLYKDASAITGTKIRRKFGTAADFGSKSGGGLVTVANNDKISLALSNEDSAGNITIRNFTLVLTRL